MFKNIKILTFVFICASTLFAQKKYSLNDCKELAIENNLNLKNSKLSISAAEQTKKEAFTKYFPHLSFIGTYFTADDKLMITQMGPITTAMLDETTLGALALMQPLYTGGRIRAGNNLSEVNKDAQNLQFGLKRDEIIIKTEELFWNLIALNEKQKTITEYEKLLDRLYCKVEDAVKSGLAIKNDLLKVKINQSEIKINKSNLENGIKLLSLSLSQHIGLSMDSSYVFSDKLVVEDTPVELYVDPQKAITKRKEAQLLDKSVEAEEYQTDMKRGEFLPELGVSVNGFYLDMLDNEGKMYTSVMASVKVPISDWWGGYHALKEREVQEKIAKNKAKDSKELLVLQIHKAWNDLNEKYRQIVLAKESVEQTTENLNLNEDSYNNGLTDISDLLEAKAKYQEAVDREIEAKANYLIQEAVYIQVTGRVIN